MTTSATAAQSDYEHARLIAVDAIEIPSDESFTFDFQVDERLGDLAAVLIQHCEELKFIDEFTVTYLWKRKGGKSGKSLTLGKCMKTAGLVHFYARTDFVIWLAADHLLYLHAVRKTVNLAALMYHELKHITQDEHDQPATQGHEFEGFADEVERFGIWREDMKPIARAFQETLFPEEAVTV